MSEVHSFTDQVAEQITSAPVEIAHPVVAGAIAAASGYLALRQVRKFNDTEDKFAARFQNEELLELVITEERDGDLEGKTPRIRSQRLAPVVGATLGAGIALAGWFGGFEYESKGPANSNARAVVVLDSSDTMRRTEDLGVEGATRFSAATEALAGSRYQGQLAAIEVAHRAKIRFPMRKDWESDALSLEKPVVDPNGTKLAEGIEKATSLLPRTRKRGSKENSTSGTLVVISDGTVTSSQAEMDKVIKEANNQNIQVKIIVPGTANATYRTDDGVPTPSAIRPETFNNFGADNVSVVTTQKKLNESVEEALDKAARTTERSKWLLPTGIGGVIMLVSGFFGRRQRVNKVV